MTPVWILDIFAGVVLTVAALSVARIAAAWLWRCEAVVTEADIAYPLMGIAMAGTLTASLRTLPDGAWDVIFAALTVLFAYQAVADVGESGVHPVAAVLVPQRVHSAAMLYMFLALAAPATGGGAAMQTLKYPTLAFVFAAVLAGCSIWDLDRLSGRRYSLARAGSGAVLADATQAGSLGQVGTARGFLLLPEMAVGCRVAMGITVTFMLLIMI